MAFASPVKQMIFALKNMANFSEIENSNVWPDINADFVESLLLEASKLADSTIAPLNHIGDKVGSKLEGADVITPPGLASDSANNALTFLSAAASRSASVLSISINKQSQLNFLNVLLN